LLVSLDLLLNYLKINMLWMSFDEFLRSRSDRLNRLGAIARDGIILDTTYDDGWR